jgi:hypothetical protein
MRVVQVRTVRDGVGATTGAGAGAGATRGAGAGAGAGGGGGGGGGVTTVAPLRADSEPPATVETAQLCALPTPRSV